VDKTIALLKARPRVDANLWPLGGIEREPAAIWSIKEAVVTDEAPAIIPLKASTP